MSTGLDKEAKAPAFCAAVAWVRLGGAARPILPTVALRYLLVLLGCFAVLIGVLELRLAALASEGRIVSEEWQSENHAIDQMNRVKLQAVTDEDPRWRSQGMPWPETRGYRRRLLVVGDSFVWGDGNDNANEIWWRQLQRELHSRGYPDVEVLALGFFGASTQDQLTWLKDRGFLARIRPDLVVLGYVTNDPDVKNARGESYVKQFGRDVPLPQWPALDRTLGKVAPHLTSQLKQHLTRKAESRVAGTYEYDEWEQRILEPPNIDAYRRVVADLGSFARSSGVPLLTVTLPNHPSVDHYRQRYRLVEPLFSAAGLRFDDLIDDFAREYPVTGESILWGVNPANGHPGPVTTRFYARKVSDTLERDFAAVLGSRQPLPARLQTDINDWMPPAADVHRVGPEEWELTYPRETDLVPRLPLGRPHVLLSFAEPAAIRSVTVAGDGLEQGDLYLDVVDPATGIERKPSIPLGTKSGSEETWPLAYLADAQHVNSLRLSAQMRPGDAGSSAGKLRLRIVFDQPPEKR
jgi:lysophospholipase L1-like esterase